MTFMAFVKRRILVLIKPSLTTRIVQVLHANNFHFFKDFMVQSVERKSVSLVFPLLADPPPHTLFKFPAELCSVHILRNR